LLQESDLVRVEGGLRLEEGEKQDCPSKKEEKERKPLGKDVNPRERKKGEEHIPGLCGDGGKKKRGGTIHPFEKEKTGFVKSKKHTPDCWKKGGHAFLQGKRIETAPLLQTKKERLDSETTFPFLRRKERNNREKKKGTGESGRKKDRTAAYLKKGGEGYLKGGNGTIRY